MQQLAALYADPKRKATPFRTTGEKTCIDCHKGIAHLLPNMTAIKPGWKDAPVLQGKGASWHGPERALSSYLAKL